MVKKSKEKIKKEAKKLKTSEEKKLKEVETKKSEEKPKESGDIKTEEVCNVFEVEKDGKEKNVEACGELKEKPANEEQIKEQNKLLRNIIIGIGVFILFFAIGFYFVNSVKHFEYNGVKFDILKEGKITFYKTSFLITYGDGKQANYNVFLRKDPRKLDNIAFEGNLAPTNLLNINSSINFNCNGDGVIAIANFQQILNALGTKVVNDPNASCDKYGRYLFINLVPGNKTEIKKIGERCYAFNINNCEILDVTERFLLEELKYRNNQF